MSSTIFAVPTDPLEPSFRVVEARAPGPVAAPVNDLELVSAGLLKFGGGGGTNDAESQPCAIRMLARSPRSIGALGAGLGVTRQAGRKVADGLEQRGYAVTERDARDSRQLNVVLTPAGRIFARDVVAVIAELNHEVASRTEPADLAAADAVLRAILFDDSARQRASNLPGPA